MTKIITSENKIIFDGHARTKEECETISLACEELAKSDKFRTVKYENGYAEFEKVGTSNELKFVGAPAIITMVFDSHITKVTGLGKEWTTSGTEITAALPNSYDGEAFAFSVTLQDGYVLDVVSANLDYGNFGNKTDNSFTLVADSSGLNGTITITSKQVTPKVNIDLITLSGYESLAAGTYQLGVKAKASGYTDSDLSSTVSFTKLAAPVVTAADTTVSWDAVTNAASYDVYVDGELYENTTGGYDITVNVTNGTYSGDTTITDTATLTIAANDGYTLPDTVTVTGATSAWNKTTGKLSISNPTGNVNVTGECVAVATRKLKISEAAYRVYVNGYAVYEPESEGMEINISSGDIISVHNDSSVSRITVNGTTYTSAQTIYITEGDIEVSGKFPGLDEFQVTIHT